ALMPPGPGQKSYIIGFEVGDAKNLRVESGAATCSPYVVVSSCGRQHRSEILEDRLCKQVNFNGVSNIWMDVLLDQEQFDSAFIEFAVYAREFFTRNQLIGKAALQLAFVNKRDGQLFRLKPVNLRKEGVAEITGILTVTCFVLQPGQSVPNWKTEAISERRDDEGQEQDDLLDINKNVLRSRALEDDNAKAYNLKINIHRIEQLQPRNGVKLSPFVTVEFAGHRVEVPAAVEVDRYAWNVTCRIPVQTPVYEETILVKLWHDPRKGASSFLKALAPDELLAVGQISFTGLWQTPLRPRWFCLYGWNPTEIPADGFKGAVPEENYFIGQLLISGSVAAVADMEDFNASAGVDEMTQLAQDPPGVQTSLMANVHEVHGVVGRSCKVELQFGEVSEQSGSVTSWVRPSQYGRHAPEQEGGAWEQEVDKDRALETVTGFIFNKQEGQMKAQMTVVPEDVESQPKVFINVWTKGVLSGTRRVAYCIIPSISDFPLFKPGQPSKPKYYTLKCMPGAERQRVPPSILMSVERAVLEMVLDDNRNIPKNILHSTYVLRAYIFMARGISTNDRVVSTEDVQVKVSCAGIMKSTKQKHSRSQKGFKRPLWMTVVELRLRLVAEHPADPPSMEPIHLTLYVPGANREIGTATCMYEYTRKKDFAGTWEEYDLRPQWVKMFGGEHDKMLKGDILVSFELLNAKDAQEEQLRAKEMWPLPASPPKLGGRRQLVDNRWTKMKKATLKFALYGLRGLVPEESSWTRPGDFLATRGFPKVSVRVKAFDGEKSKPYKLVFKLQSDEKQKGRLQVLVKKREGGSKPESVSVTADCSDQPLKYWPSVDGLGRDGKNYEFFAVESLNITLPADTVLEPNVRIIVKEQAGDNIFKTSMLQGKSRLIGEHSLNLCGLLPCNWYGVEGLPPDATGENFKKHKGAIERAKEEAMKKTKARRAFQEETRTLKKPASEERGAGAASGSGGARGSEQRFALESSELVDAMALPCQFTGYVPKGIEWGLVATALEKPHDPDVKALDRLLAAENIKQSQNTLKGKQKHPIRGCRQKLSIPMDMEKCDARLNMHMAKGLEPQKGPKLMAEKGSASGRPQLKGSLEEIDYRADDGEYWTPDFYFHGRPLLRDHDLFDEALESTDRSTDWHFSPECRGFVKFALKVTDGWENDSEDDLEDEVNEEGGDSSSSGDEQKALPDETGGNGGDGGGISAGGTRGLSWSSSMVKSKGRWIFADGDGWSDFFSMQRTTEKDPDLVSYKIFPDDRVPGGVSKGQNVKLGEFRQQCKVRVRIYFVRGVCTYADPDGSTNPYIQYSLGGLNKVSMKSMVRMAEPTPDFYRVEERDIDMPADAQLIVELWDKDEPTMLASAVPAVANSDTLIGSSFIDLEDRWYSKRWNRDMKRQRICKETRKLTSLKDPLLNNGTIEMWIEMVETDKVSATKLSALNRDPPVEVDVRIVIWEVKDVRLVDGDHTDAKVVTKLECNNKYGGEPGYPKTQSTDAHWNCQDNAEFNYRVISNRNTHHQLHYRFFAVRREQN
ncbi:unnamed protein product, partial [Prorocentrum cordatum]